MFLFFNESRLMRVKVLMRFSLIFLDVNEVPSDLCNAPILVGLKTSVGTVIAVLQGSDPDNENEIHGDPSNHSVVIRNKQHLTYSLTPEQNSWPFSVDRNSLFKSEVRDINYDNSLLVIFDIINND